MVEMQNRLLGNGWRIAGWSAAAALLVLPAIAMQFNDEVNWTVGDFVAAAVLLGLLGAGLEWALRTARNWPRFLGLALAVFTAFFTVWSNLAVGILGDEDNPVNLLFFVALLIALVAAGLVRFRSLAMARILTVLAAAQFVIGIVAAVTADRVYVEWGVLVMFTVLWSVTAFLLRRAARR